MYEIGEDVEMRYYNVLEPKFICDRAIKVLKRERNRLDTETKDYVWSNNRSLEKDIENYEKRLLIADYNRLISDLEKLGEFGVQQMEEIVKNGDKKGEWIY